MGFVQSVFLTVEVALNVAAVGGAGGVPWVETCVPTLHLVSLSLRGVFALCVDGSQRAHAEEVVPVKSLVTSTRTFWEPFPICRMLA